MTAYTTCLDTDTVLKLLDEASQADMIAVDTETNGKDVRDKKRGMLYGISIAYELHNEVTSFYIPFRHPFSVENLPFNIVGPVLQKLFDTKPLIFFNIKFDAFSLETIGLNVWESNLYDIMIITHDLNENHFEYSLEALSRIYLDKDGKKLKGTPYERFIKRFGYEQVPAAYIAEYGAWDADLTLRLFKKNWPAYIRGTDDGVALWKHRLEVLKVLASMERVGIGIDQELCQKMVERGESEMMMIQDQLGGLNPGSPKDLEVLLLDKLQLDPIYHPKTGNLTFNKEAMEVYEGILERSNNKTAQQILAFRGWRRSVSSNYRTYLERLCSDFMLRCNYLQHGTVTGRMSCQQPNLQQIPRSGSRPWDGNMKKCFIPGDPDFVLIEADYKQLELRLATTYGRDPKLIESFENGIDVFDVMAIDLDMIRYSAKTLSYLLQYGGGPPRIEHVFGVPNGVAKSIQSNFFSTYPGLRNARQRAKNLAAVNRFIRTWSGRRCHIAFPSQNHKAFNKAIQGGAADIVERAMLRVRDKGWLDGDIQLKLQVHDSLVLRVPIAELQPRARELKEVFEDVHPNFGVKFEADIHYWGGEKIL